jgi:hypothetical protein
MLSNLIKMISILHLDFGFWYLGFKGSTRYALSKYNLILLEHDTNI